MVIDSATVLNDSNRVNDLLDAKENVKTVAGGGINLPFIKDGLINKDDIHTRYQLAIHCCI